MEFSVVAIAPSEQLLNAWSVSVNFIYLLKHYFAPSSKYERANLKVQPSLQK